MLNCSCDRTVNAPVALSFTTPFHMEATVNGMEMVEPGSMLVLFI